MNSTTIASGALANNAHRWGWLPPVGSWKYYALLGFVGIMILAKFVMRMKLIKPMKMS